ncbi:MAG: hypothetical protein LBV49_10250 [Azonexus sp.]|jgi:hypothetical protein|nr:hypothetical protein [Azonexus sp.]
MTTKTKAAPEAVNPITGTRCMYNVVTELWDRCADQLTPEELEWFSGAGESADSFMQNLEEVIDGLCCLVGADNKENTKHPVGSFQESGSVATLLFFIGQSVNHARALVEVSNSADLRLRRPDAFACA